MNYVDFKSDHRILNLTWEILRKVQLYHPSTPYAWLWNLKSQYTKDITCQAKDWESLITVSTGQKIHYLLLIVKLKLCLHSQLPGKRMREISHSLNETSQIFTNSAYARSIKIPLNWIFCYCRCIWVNICRFTGMKFWQRNSVALLCLVPTKSERSYIGTLLG